MSDKIVADKLIQYIKNTMQSLSELNHYMDKELRLKPDIRVQAITFLVGRFDTPLDEIEYKAIERLILEQSK
jgi:hypothetical protein